MKEKFIKKMYRTDSKLHSPRKYFFIRLFYKYCIFQCSRPKLEVLKFVFQVIKCFTWIFIHIKITYTIVNSD